jgi:hypothetical protein
MKRLHDEINGDKQQELPPKMTRQNTAELIIVKHQPTVLCFSVFAFIYICRSFFLSSRICCGYFLPEEF